MSVERTPRGATLIATESSSVLCTNLLVGSGTTANVPPRLTPTGKISHAKTRVYTQRYRKEWELMSEFKGWLTSVPFQQTRAYCLYCKKNLHAHRLSLLKHTCTMKHQRAALAHETEEKKKRKSESGTPEVGLVEEVETMDESVETIEENEEDIEYIVERLDTEDEDIDENENKDAMRGLVIEGEEREKEIDQDLCAQLQSDDEDSKPVIKKIKLIQEEKCRDTLAQAMAHVHNEYLEDEVGDQEGVQMEMVVDEQINTDVCMLPESTDDTRELCEDEKSALCTELKADAKSTEKVFEGEKGDIIEAAPLPILDAVYQTNISSVPAENAINFVPISPNPKINHKTVTLTCGSKTFTLTGGTFQPGTQYILTKLKGKSATLVLADQKKPATTTEEKNKILQVEPVTTSNINQPIASTSQQSPIVVANNQQTGYVKGFSPKKIIMGKATIKTNVKKLRISTYVVDNTKGLPISGLQVSVYKLMDGKWTFLNESTTNVNGFCFDLVEKINCTTGRYKLHFDVDKYFTLRRIETMFPFVEVVFDVKTSNTTCHYHMPLLLSPFSYTIYRGI